MQQYTLTRDLREDGLNSLRITEYQYFETLEQMEHFTTAIFIEGGLPTTVGTCAHCNQQGFLLGKRCMIHKRDTQLIRPGFAGMVGEEDFPLVYLWKIMAKLIENVATHTLAHLQYMGAWAQDYHFKILLYTCFTVEEMEAKLHGIEWTPLPIVLNGEHTPTNVWALEDSWHEFYKMEFLNELPLKSDDNGMAFYGQMPLFLTTNLN